MHSDTIDKLRARLTDARAVLDAVLDRVGDRWDTPVYAAGDAWTARDLLIHLMISDRGQSKTVQTIAQGGDPLPADFDLERYNSSSVKKAAATTPEEARASLAASRADLLAWLPTVTEPMLAQSGRHASGNIFTVAQYLKIMALHERDHANDLARALGDAAAG